jgi:SOS-response transcriptional repressor LexA
MPFASSLGKCHLHHAERYHQTVSNPADRLKAAREAAGYETAKAAAEAMGVAVATYIQHENGTRGYPSSRADRYASFFRTSPEWLLYGRGKTPRRREALSPEVRRVSRMVPIVGSVQAGAWAEVESDYLDPPEVVPVYLAGFEGAQLFALRVRGPSMDRFYPDGTMVIVCPAAEIGVREGDHVVVRRHRGGLCETTIKEVVREKGGIALWPRSTDPGFQEPIRLALARDADEGPEIIGVVVSSYVIRPIQQKPLIQL